MADDNALNGSEQAPAQAASPTSPSAQPVTPASPGLSEEALTARLAQVEARLRAEYEAKLENVTNQAKSVADRKRNEALRRAKLLDEIAPDVGLEPDQLEQVKRKVIDRAFYDDKPEPEPPSQIQLTAQPQPPPLDDDAYEVAVRKAAKKQFGIKGVELNAFFDEARQIQASDPQAEEKWNALGRKYVLAQAKREEQAAADAKREGAADKVSEIVTTFGGTGAMQPGGAAPVGEEGLRTQIERLNKQIEHLPVEQRQPLVSERSKLMDKLRALDRAG